VCATALIRAPPTFCACRSAPTRMAAGNRWAVAVQFAIADVTPRVPSTASPTEVPSWRDAFTTLEAAPEIPDGTSRIATWVTPGTRRPKPAPHSRKPTTVTAKGAGEAARLSAKTPAAPATHPAATTRATG
jgi:hypothetical protein